MEKTIKFDSSKRITIKFAKDFGAYKKGDEAQVGLALAASWVSQKAATLTKESKNYVEEHQLGAMFKDAAAEETKTE